MLLENRLLFWIASMLGILFVGHCFGSRYHGFVNVAQYFSRHVKLNASNLALTITLF